jgi:4-amino-4-deoxy-L-arabinose transferase-like glycosyltransferase
MSIRRSLLTTLFLVWVAWSFSQSIYSTADLPQQRATRWELFEYLVLSREPNHPVSTFLRSWGDVDLVGWLSERSSVVAMALAIIAASIALGNLALRAIRLSSDLSRGEWIVFSWGVGTALLSTAIQASGLVGQTSRAGFYLFTGLAVIGSLLMKSGRPTNASLPSRGAWIAFGVTLPIILLSYLGALLPTPDYDAHAYHLLGPKEWMEAGRITFLPHNVYTTFPFLTEMFSYLGMILAGDHFRGGLVGQTVLATFGPMTGAAIFFVGQRIYSTEAGLWGAVAYTASPWFYRLSSIPYVEGAMLCYLTIGLLAVSVESAASLAAAWVIGVMAGGAFGCKYPALVMVAIPLFTAMLTQSRERVVARGWMFAVGFLSIAGICLARNYVWTGNPIFPLLDPLFGSHHWSVERYEHFRSAHQSTTFDIKEMVEFIQDVVIRSDWQSALAFAGVPFAFARGRRWLGLGLVVLIAYQFLIFFVGTHRLDRFFLAILPVAAILSGAGLATLMTAGWRWVVILGAGLIVVYNTLFCLTPLAGFNLFAERLEKARLVAIDAVSPTLSALRIDRRLDPHATVLYVGLAAVYEAPTRSLYNTVFDESLLSECILDHHHHLPSVLARDACVKNLRDRETDFIVVDWTWINRYRQPGNYGFPSFVEPALLDRLVREKVLRPIKVDGVWDLYQVVSEPTSP